MHITRPSAKFALASAWLIALISTSCGKVQVKNAGGNAILVLDATKDIAVTDQELTLKRFRVWKSSPNDSGPGVSSVIDTYAAEIWFRVVGEESDQYALISDLQSDSSGNLFPIGNRPGKVSTIINEDRNIRTYTVTAEDGLITQKFDIYDRWSFTSSAAATNPKTVSQTFKPIREFGVTEWANLYSYTMSGSALLYSRGRMVENTSGLSAKAVCTVVKANLSSGAITESIKPATSAFELGTYYDSSSNNGKGQTDANGKSNERQEDKLYVKYVENWYVTGINIGTRAVRTMRARTADIYVSRHLKADTSATTPAESGYNKLVRECNVAAKPASGETGTSNIYTVSSLGQPGTDPNPLEPEFNVIRKLSGNTELTDHTYCAALETATNAKDYMVSLVSDATATPPGLDCGGDWSTVETGEVWSAADGYTVSVGETNSSNQYSVEQTAITASVF